MGTAGAMRSTIGVSLTGDLHQLIAIVEEVDQLLAVASGYHHRLRPPPAGGPGACGPSAFGPSASTPRASSSWLASSPSPVSTRASGMFGVATVQVGSSTSTS